MSPPVEFKKPFLQFSVPCLSVKEDQGPPSFMNIFYELPFPEFPFTFPGMGFFIANGWCNGKGDFKQSMRILKPDKGILVQTGDQPFSLREEKTPFMAINLFQGVTFDAPGIYWVQVFLDDVLTLEYPMEVRKAEPVKK